AGVGGAGVAVDAVGRRAGDARTGLADLGTVAERGVGARGAIDDVHVNAAGDGVAGVDRARVAVVAVGRRPGRAGAALAGLGAVADRRVGARGAVRHGGVLAAGNRVAAVARADVVVVAGEGDAGRAGAVLAGLGPVADRRVGARSAVRHVGE